MSTNSVIPVDACACPLCGQPNRCAIEAQRNSGMSSTSKEPCWCTKVSFSAELLSRVPEQAQRKACICETCARIN